MTIIAKVITMRLKKIALKENDLWGSFEEGISSGV